MARPRIGIGLGDSSDLAQGFWPQGEITERPREWVSTRHVLRLMETWRWSIFADHKVAEVMNSLALFPLRFSITRAWQSTVSEWH